MSRLLDFSQDESSPWRGEGKGLVRPRSITGAAAVGSGARSISNHLGNPGMYPGCPVMATSSCCSSSSCSSTGCAVTSSFFFPPLTAHENICCSSGGGLQGFAPSFRALVAFVVVVIDGARFATRRTTWPYLVYTCFFCSEREGRGLGN